MIHIKTPQEVEAMHTTGKLLVEIVKEVIASAKAGVSLQMLDTIAKDAMEKRGAASSTIGYKGGGSMPPFPAHFCASVNDEIVHAPASREILLKDGDIVGLDISIVYNGWHADMAETIAVGEIPNETKRLLEVTKKSLFKGIEKAVVGNTLKDIGQSVFDYVEHNKYGTVTSFCGHGIGKEIHEEPQVPNYPTKKAKEVVLKEGMVIAIEPMVTTGRPALEITDDGWTAKTEDGGLGAHFERTVAITKDGPQILTELE